MRSAPRDGTMILVCEIAGDEASVMPAAFVNAGGEDERFDGVWTTSRLPIRAEADIARQKAVNARGLPVGFRSIALTPLCWMPLPEPEPLAKLSRRESQILAQLHPKPKAAPTPA